MELGAEFLPQRLIVPARFHLAVVVVVDVAGTCNGFTEILDAFATAASSARICVYNEDTFMRRGEKRRRNERAREFRNVVIILLARNVFSSRKLSHVFFFFFYAHAYQVFFHRLFSQIFN